MVDWRRVIFSDFEDDEEIREKLHAHGLQLEEVVQCFYNPFQVKKNKTFGDRYQLIGRTDAGRKLKIIFQLRFGNVVRIITGWDV